MSFYSSENYSTLLQQVLNLHDNDESIKEQFDINYKNFKLDNFILEIKFEKSIVFDDYARTQYINKAFLDKYYDFPPAMIPNKLQNTQDFSLDDYRNMHVASDDTLIWKVSNKIPLRQKVGYNKNYERDIEDTLPNTINNVTPVYKSFDAARRRK